MDVRHADDRADERRIGHAHEQHAEVGDDADEHGGDDLAHNIAAEDAVRPAGQLQQAVGMLAAEDRHGDLLGLRTELFLKDQDIYGRDDAEQDIEDDYTYDTSKIEAFLLPKGTVAEVYATTLHYAPCSVDGNNFRCVVVLPKDTNLDLEVKPEGAKEDPLLVARNKWLIAHEEAKIEGAFNGLKGENISVE